MIVCWTSKCCGIFIDLTHWFRGWWCTAFPIFAYIRSCSLHLVLHCKKQLLWWKKREIAVLTQTHINKCNGLKRRRTANSTINKQTNTCNGIPHISILVVTFPSFMILTVFQGQATVLIFFFFLLFFCSLLTLTRITQVKSFVSVSYFKLKWHWML